MGTGGSAAIDGNAITSCPWLKGAAAADWTTSGPCAALATKRLQQLWLGAERNKELWKE
jgi:hypothetical protein